MPKGITLIGGAKIPARTRILYGKGTLTPGATGAGPVRSSCGTIAVDGAKLGDAALVKHPAAAPAACMFQAEVTANGVVTVWCFNMASTQTPATGVYEVTVIAHRR